jgi:hypothetical protein
VHRSLLPIRFGFDDDALQSADEPVQTQTVPLLENTGHAGLEILVTGAEVWHLQ